MSMKEKGTAHERPDRYGDIRMPKNTAHGFVLGGLAFIFGFALVWYIWWLAILSGLAMLFTVIARACDDDTHYTIPAAEVERIEEGRRLQMAQGPRQAEGQAILRPGGRPVP
jgi:cytochrome o ubiquinol oxidase subunit 1